VSVDMAGQGSLFEIGAMKHAGAWVKISPRPTGGDASLGWGAALTAPAFGGVEAFRIRTCIQAVYRRSENAPGAIAPAPG
jgi:hypothetical protein